MRVLLIALQSYMPTGYRAKLDWLATEGGIDLTLATMRSWRGPTGTETWEDGLAPSGRPIPFEVRFIKPLALAAHPTLRVVAPGDLRRLIDETQPDIVHVEAEPHSLLMATVARMKRRSGLNLVGFSWENIHRRGKPPLGWIERATLAQVDWMTVGNTEGIDVMRWRGYRGEISVVPQFGFAPEQFEIEVPQPALMVGDGATFRIGYVGRLAEEKGLWDLLRSLGELPQAHLYMVGSGSLEQPLRRRAAALGLAERVHLVGALPHSEVVSLLQHVNALVLPSRTLFWWKEQFGRVLVEAMLSKTVVVGSDSGAIPEVIGDAGMVFPEGDVAALAQCLRRLMADSQLAQRLAQAGYDRARSYYTGEAIGQATLDVYRQVQGMPSAATNQGDEEAGPCAC